MEIGTPINPQDNAANPNGQIASPPLITAILQHSPQIVQYLLDNGANVEQMWVNHTPLLLAYKCSSLDAIRKIAAVSDVETINFDGNTALHLSCMNKNSDVIRYAIERKEYINARNVAKEIPLHVACRENNAEYVKLLIENGSDLNAVNKNSETPLHIACSKGNYQLVEYLLQNNAPINQIDAQHNTPLHLAAMNGQIDIVRLLIENRASTVMQNKAGKTPYDVAIGQAKQILR